MRVGSLAVSIGSFTFFIAFLKDASTNSHNLSKDIQGKSCGDGAGLDGIGDNGGHHFCVPGDWTEGKSVIKN